MDSSASPDALAFVHALGVPTFVLACEAGLPCQFVAANVLMTPLVDDPLAAVGRSVDDMVAVEVAEELTKGVQQCLAQQSAYTLALHDEAKRRWTECILTPLPGSRARVVGTIHDVTARIEAERARERAEEKFNRAFGASPDIITITDLKEGQIYEVNPAFEQLTGYSRAEALGKTTLELDFWDDLADRGRLLQQMEQHGRVRDFEINIRNRHGEALAGVMSCELIQIKGQPYILTITRDVTSLQETQQALQITHSQLRVALSAARMGVWQWDIVTNEVVWSERVEALFGLSPGTFDGTYEAYMALIPQAEHPGVLAAITSALEGEGDYSVAHRVLLPQGEYRWLEAKGRIFRDDAARPLRMIGVVADITERKQAEQALRESEQRYRSVVEDQTEFIVRGRPDGVLTFVNQSYARYFGRTPDRLVGFNFYDLIPEADQPAVRQKLASLTPEHPVATDEHRALLPDGRLRWHQWTDRMLFDDDGQAVAFQSIGRDITERHEAIEALERLNAGLEERVRERTARYEAANRELESFSYSVSHDLRAPLRAIQGFTSILQRNNFGQLDEGGQRYLTYVLESTERMDNCIEAILALSRISRRPLDRQPVDLTQLAEATVAELRHAAPERAVRFQAAPGLRAVGDRRFLQVVLQNLIGNAWKYTRLATDAEISFGADLDADAPVFWVKDNGVGFDPSFADKLFTPFQRLHNDDQFEGNGIGLATVHRIITRHGGTLRAEGQPGGGATFYFTLPSQVPPAAVGIEKA